MALHRDPRLGSGRGTLCLALLTVLRTASVISRVYYVTTLHQCARHRPALPGERSSTAIPSSTCTSKLTLGLRAVPKIQGRGLRGTTLQAAELLARRQVAKDRHSASWGQHSFLYLSLRPCVSSYSSFCAGSANVCMHRGPSQS